MAGDDDHLLRERFRRRTAIDRAARVHNRAGIGVRLRRAASASAADVVFVYGGRRCEGSSYVGFQRRRTSTVDLGRGCSEGLITLTADDLRGLRAIYSFDET